METLLVERSRNWTNYYIKLKSGFRTTFLYTENSDSTHRISSLHLPYPTLCFRLMFDNQMSKLQVLRYGVLRGEEVYSFNKYLCCDSTGFVCMSRYCEYTRLPDCSPIEEKIDDIIKYFWTSAFWNGRTVGIRPYPAWDSILLKDNSGVDLDDLPWQLSHFPAFRAPYPQVLG